MCGKGTNTTTSNTSSTQTPNPQAMNLYQNILQMAQNTAGTPYSPFTGQGVAPINSQQQAGISGVNSYQPWYSSALYDMAAAGQPITQADIEQYMSPYTSDVVNATEAQFANTNAQQLQQVKGNAIAQGALGGNREGIAEAETVNQQDLAQAPVIANLENQGYQTGLNTALTEQGVGMQTALGLGSLAGQGIAGANQRISAGNLIQQTAQAQDTYALQQYYQQMGYPFEVAQWLAGVGGSIGSLMGGTTTDQGTTTGPAPSWLGQLISGGMAGIGLLGGTGAFGSTGYLNPSSYHKFGGGVNGYEAGGGVAGPVRQSGGNVMPWSTSNEWIPGAGGLPVNHSWAPKEMEAPKLGTQAPPSSGLNKDSMQGLTGLGNMLKGGLSGGTPSAAAWTGSGADLGTIGAGVGADATDFMGGALDLGASIDAIGAGLEGGDAAAALLPLMLVKRGGGVKGYDLGGSPDADDVPYDVASAESGDVGPSGVAGGVPMITGAQVPDQHGDVPLPMPKPVIEPAPTADTGVVPTPRHLPRGLRNNNPGNIEDGPFARSQPGYTGSDGRFAQFDSMDNGRAATGALLGSYGNKGLNTISGIVNRWAPAADNNDTNAYIRAVSKATGYAPSEPLDMSDPTVRTKIADAIHAHENGMPAGYLNTLDTRGYNRAYGALDIPPDYQPFARNQVPAGVAGPAPQADRWGANNPLWSALLAGGAEGLASGDIFAGKAVGKALQGAQGYVLGQQQVQMNQQKIDQEAQRIQNEADRWERQYRLELQKQMLEETKPQTYNDPIMGPRPIFRDPKSPSGWVFGDTGLPVGPGAGGAQQNIPPSDDPTRPFKNATPSSATIMQGYERGLHGQAMVDTIPQPLRNTAEAVANYQAPLSDFTKMGRSGISQDRALGMVRQINPDYDQNWYSVRGQGYKNTFASTNGQSALVQSRTYNTATGHAGELAQAFHDLNAADPGGLQGVLKAAHDSGTPFLSYLAGVARQRMATGTPEGQAWAKINAIVPLYGAETEKFYAGGQGSETGRQAIQNPFNSARSYTELMAALYQQKEMFKSKTAPLEDEYKDIFEGGPGQKEYGTNQKLREWHIARDSAQAANEVIDRYAKEAGVNRVGVAPGQNATQPNAPAAPAAATAPTYQKQQIEQWLRANPNDPRAGAVRQKLQQMP